MIDVYESAIDHRGRFGVVFERDDDTSYLYLLDLARAENDQIVEAFDVYTVNAMPKHISVILKWNSSGSAAGLLIDGDLIALFDLGSEAPYGRWAVQDDRDRFSIH